MKMTLRGKTGRDQKADMFNNVDVEIIATRWTEDLKILKLNETKSLPSQIRTYKQPDTRLEYESEA